MYLQQQQTSVFQPLSHGLFPLEVLLVSISQVLSAFFTFANANLADFSALTAFRAPEFNKEERKSQAKKQRQACKEKQVLKMRFTFRGLSNFQVLDTFITQVDKSLH
jgi:hypothetical protein